MAVNQTTLGWTFESHHTLEQMKRQLDAARPAPWSMGDSERLGDYLGGRLTPQAVARIYATGQGRYAVNLRFYSTEGDALSQLAEAKRELLERALPAIEATHVASTEPLD